MDATDDVVETSSERRVFCSQDSGSMGMYRRFEFWDRAYVGILQLAFFRQLNNPQKCMELFILKQPRTSWFFFSSQ